MYQSAPEEEKGKTESDEKKDECGNVQIRVADCETKEVKTGDEGTQAPTDVDQRY